MKTNAPYNFLTMAQLVTYHWHSNKRFGRLNITHTPHYIHRTFRKPLFSSPGEHTVSKIKSAHTF